MYLWIVIYFYVPGLMTTVVGKKWVRMRGIMSVFSLLPAVRAADAWMDIVSLKAHGRLSGYCRSSGGRTRYCPVLLSLYIPFLSQERTWMMNSRENHTVIRQRFLVGQTRLTFRKNTYLVTLTRIHLPCTLLTPQMNFWSHLSSFFVIL